MPSSRIRLALRIRCELGVRGGGRRGWEVPEDTLASWVILGRQARRVFYRLVEEMRDGVLVVRACGGVQEARGEA